MTHNRLRTTVITLPSHDIPVQKGHGKHFLFCVLFLVLKTIFFLNHNTYRFSEVLNKRRELIDGMCLGSLPNPSP